MIAKRPACSPPYQALNATAKKKKTKGVPLRMAGTHKVSSNASEMQTKLNP
jgi:hypothetical protein